jgi:hypothetical protein
MCRTCICFKEVATVTFYELETNEPVLVMDNVKPPSNEDFELTSFKPFPKWGSIIDWRYGKNGYQVWNKRSY